MSTLTPESRKASALHRPRGAIAEVAVDELLAGSRLGFPVHDASGVLLLAAGSIITDELKTNLRRRTRGKLQVAVEDVSVVTARPREPAPAEQFDEGALLEQIDRLVNTAMKSMQGGGRPLRNEIVMRGCVGYDARQRQRLADQHARNINAIGDLAAQATVGRQCDGGIIGDMAAEYLRELKADPASAVSSAALFASDALLERHAIEVCLVAMAIGIEMDLDAEQVRQLGIAGLTNDFGMVRVPPAIRNAPRKLHDQELREIRRHPRYSFELLARMRHLPPSIPAIAYQVHERFDGSGYPHGRAGKEILLPARVLQVADTFVAMASRRPHRPALSRYRTMERVVRMAGKRRFDPEVVRALLRAQSLFPLNSFVRLSDGSRARVVRSNRDAYAAPIVELNPDEFPEERFPNGESTIVDLKNAPIAIAQALRTPGRDEREQDA
jgi:HD-GYP domain-containing protein (c-di-GMP phosphodiesterase class II)